MSKKAKITDLRLDTHNANKGTERGRAALEKSLRNLGAGRSILVDKNGKAIAGNKTLEVAAELGLPIEVVETDGNTLVVVKRNDLDLDKDSRARELAYADNRVAELDLEWDLDVLAADAASDAVDLSGFFSDKELAKLIGDDAAGGWNGSEEGNADTDQLGAMKYSLIVECNGEKHQAELMTRLEQEGLTCRPLIS